MELNQVKEEYKSFVKELDIYEKQKYNEWSNKIEEKALEFLKKKILKKENENYEVNFSNQFKLLINESKNIDKLGFSLKKIILNIALQQK